MTKLTNGSMAADPGRAPVAIVKHDEGAHDIASGLMPRSFNDVARISSALSKARGFVPSSYIGNAPAIAAAIMTGLEVGIGPMQALREIHVIEGKPTLSATMMLALAIRAGVRHQWLRADDEEAHLRLTRAGWEPHEQRFTMADAKRAGLAGRGNWGKHPAAMLRARCLSAAMRAFCPDVLGGSVYVEGEIEPEHGHARASATALEPEHGGDVIDMPTLDAQLDAAEAACAQGEASCAAPEASAAAEHAAPTALGDCATAEHLRAWCAKHGATVVKRGATAKVTERAGQIGVSEADALTYLGLSPDAA